MDRNRQKIRTTVTETLQQFGILAKEAHERLTQYLEHDLAAGDADIPIGNDDYKDIMNLTRYPVTHQNKVKGATRRFQKQTEAGQLAFSFAALSGFYTEHRDFNDSIPTVHTNARHTLAAIWYFTKNTKAEPLEGTATAAELAKIRGLELRGGNDFARINNQYLTIATGTFSITTPDRIRGYPFFLWWEMVGTGKNTRYFWELNPASISDVTRAWIAGELTAELASDTGGFVAYPKRYLSENLDAHLENVRDTLLTYRHWGRPLTYLTVCKWGGLSETMIKKYPPKTAELLESKWFPKLKERGYIGDYETVNPQGKSGTRKVSLRALKVKLTKPSKPAGQVKLTPEQQNQFEEVIECLTQTYKTGKEKGENVHGIRKPPQQQRGDIMQAVKRNGFPLVWQAYKDFLCNAEPDSRKFWNAISPEEHRKRKPKPDKPDPKPTPKPKPKPTRPSRATKQQQEQREAENDRRRELCQQIENLKDDKGSKA